MIAVHGVFHKVAGDEKVAVKIRNRDLGNHKAVAILVENKAALDFIARNDFLLREIISGWLRTGPGF
jgi:hypothetical protein